MKAQMFIQSKEEMLESQRELFKELIHEEFPKLVRKSRRKAWLTTKDLKEDFGISFELQKYYRDENLIEFSQEGRKIWYPTESVEKFLESRKIESKK